MRSNPNSADAYNSLGNTLNCLGRQEEAIDQYRFAVALRENFPEAQVNLGNSFKALGRYREAAAKLTAPRSPCGLNMRRRTAALELRWRG